MRRVESIAVGIVVDLCCAAIVRLLFCFNKHRQSLQINKTKTASFRRETHHVDDASAVCSASSFDLLDCIFVRCVFSYKHNTRNKQENDR
jgi:hypothetical protein